MLVDLSNSRLFAIPQYSTSDDLISAPICRDMYCKLHYNYSLFVSVMTTSSFPSGVQGSKTELKSVKLAVDQLAQLRSST